MITLGHGLLGLEGWCFDLFVHKTCFMPGQWYDYKYFVCFT